MANNLGSSTEAANSTYVPWWRTDSAARFARAACSAVGRQSSSKGFQPSAIVGQQKLTAQQVINSSQRGIDSFDKPELAHLEYKGSGVERSAMVLASPEQKPRSIKQAAHDEPKSAALMRDDESDDAKQLATELGVLYGDSKVFDQAAVSTVASHSVVQENSCRIVKQLEEKTLTEDQMECEIDRLEKTIDSHEKTLLEMLADLQAQSQVASLTGKASAVNGTQWIDLFRSCRDLLETHYAYLLATQHRSGLPREQSQLLKEAAMKQRQRRHGINEPLDFMLKHQPASEVLVKERLYCFLSFTYMIADLSYEAAPKDIDYWAAILSDLARCKASYTASPDEENMWRSVAQQKCVEIANRNPSSGWVKYCMARLKQDTVIRLAGFCAAFSAKEPYFEAKKDFIHTANIRSTTRKKPNDYNSLALTFVAVHKALMNEVDRTEFKPLQKELLRKFEAFLEGDEKSVRMLGPAIAIANFSAMLGFGNGQVALIKKVKNARYTNYSLIAYSLKWFCEEINEKRRKRVLPLLHACATFMNFVAKYDDTMRCFAQKFPWEEVADSLNLMIKDNKQFFPEADLTTPFPEDFWARGLMWAKEDKVANISIGPDSKMHLERPTPEDPEAINNREMMDYRRQEEILKSAHSLAKKNVYLTFDEKLQKFSAGDPRFWPAIGAKASLPNSLELALGKSNARFGSGIFKATDLFNDDRPVA